MTRCSSYFWRAALPTLPPLEPVAIPGLATTPAKVLLIVFAFKLFRRLTFLAGPVGFEPTTPGLEGRCYVQTKPRAQCRLRPFFISVLVSYKYCGTKPLFLAVE